MTIKESFRQIKIIKRQIRRDIKEGLYSYFLYEYKKTEFYKLYSNIQKRTKSQAVRIRVSCLANWILATEKQINNNF